MKIKTRAALVSTLGALALAACGSAHPPTSHPASVQAVPAPAAQPAAAPVITLGQSVTFSWPGSSGDGRATSWKVTLLGVHKLKSGPLSGQPHGYRDFCLELKFTLKGPLAYAQYSGQLDPDWTWKGASGQVIGGSDGPAFDSADCQMDAFPGSEDIAGGATAPAPGQFVMGSEAFSVPAGSGVLWLDAQSNNPLALAGFRY